VAANTSILRRRWPRVLSHRPPPFDAPGHEMRVLSARDADALERILVVAEDALPENLLEAVLDRHPTGRITLLGVRWRPGREELERLLAQGVEVAASGDAAAWIEERPFHHTAVLCPEGYPPPQIARALMEWQPQAPVITMGAGGRGDLVGDLLGELDAAGILAEHAVGD
jgi:hypothetical protein